MRTNLYLSIATSIAFVATYSAHASITDFNESFNTGTANWRGASSATLLNWNAAGGPSDDAYVSSLLNLSSTSGGGFPANAFPLEPSDVDARKTVAGKPPALVELRFKRLDTYASPLGPPAAFQLSSVALEAPRQFAVPVLNDSLSQ